MRFFGRSSLFALLWLGVGSIPLEEPSTGIVHRSLRYMQEEHPPPKPKPSGSGGGGGGSSSGGSSSGGSGGGGSSSSGGGGGGGSSSGSGGGSGSSSSGGGGGSGGSGGGGGSGSSTSNSTEPGSHKAQHAGVLGLAAAAMIAGAAIAVAASRRRPVETPKHSLQGSVNRRIALFSHLAKHSAGRPSRRVEEETPYVLQPNAAGATV